MCNVALRGTPSVGSNTGRKGSRLGLENTLYHSHILRRSPSLNIPPPFSQVMVECLEDFLRCHEEDRTLDPVELQVRECVEEGKYDGEDWT